MSTNIYDREISMEKVSIVRKLVWICPSVWITWNNKFPPHGSATFFPVGSHMHERYHASRIYWRSRAQLLQRRIKLLGSWVI